jgi:hypothetical protein
VSWALLAVAFAVFGVGYGAVNTVIAAVAVAGPPRAQAGVAGGITSAGRQAGQSLGVSVVGAVFATGLHGLLRDGFATASHPAWLVIAACGFIVLPLGLVSTARRAVRAAALAAGTVPDHSGPPQVVSAACRELHQLPYPRDWRRIGTRMPVVLGCPYLSPFADAHAVAAPPARTSLQDGDPVLAGCHPLIARLGAGGMGVVYLGTDPEPGDGRLVAVKVLCPELADDPEFGARFSREVAVLARVRGARIVRVIEVGDDACGPANSGSRRRGAVRRLASRRMAMTAVPLLVVMVAAALALALPPGRGTTTGRPGPSASPFGTYPGEQGRGVFQTISRIAASGGTIVTTGAQVSDGVMRQQFFASADGGASWRLAPVSLRRRPAPAGICGHPAGRRPTGVGGHRHGRARGHLDQHGRPVLDAGGQPRDRPAAARRPDLGSDRHRPGVPGGRSGSWARRQDAGGDLDLA